MSRQFNNKKFNNSTNANTNSRKPFCKVCADAGKTDTAHFPRKTADPNSEVVCPTLLSLECRYCFKNGHTVKYCTVLKERNARDEQYRREEERYHRQEERKMEQERQARLPPIVENKAISKFAVLLDEDEEEERKERQEEEMRLKIEEAAAALVAKREAEFPTFGLKSAPKTAPVTTNWSVMAQNAAALPLPKPKAKAVVEQKPKAKTTSVGWADDSDDEYEEERYESVLASDNETSYPRPFTFPALSSSTPCYARASYDDNDW